MTHYLSEGHWSTTDGHFIPFTGWDKINSKWRNSAWQVKGAFASGNLKFTLQCLGDGEA